MIGAMLFNFYISLVLVVTNPILPLIVTAVSVGVYFYLRSVRKSKRAIQKAAAFWLVCQAIVAAALFAANRGGMKL